MKPEDMRRELDNLKEAVAHKPSRGWVIAASIISTLLVLVLVAALMMFAMANMMRGGGWRGYGHDRYIDRHYQPSPPPPPGQPLPR